MEIVFTLNSKQKTIQAEAGENVQALLKRLGMNSVRNSDDGFGFAGSDTILLDGHTVNASLLIAAQLQGREVVTPESLNEYGKLHPVQSALIDAGVIQSGYNDPALALLISDLLKRHPDPSRAEVIDTLSSIFLRESAYQQVFDAVDIARQRMADPEYVSHHVPSFAGDYRQVGKPGGKVDAERSIKAEPCFVEDFVAPDACVLKMLRSPHAHAFISGIDTRKAEAMPGVVAVFDYRNCPDVYYTPGGQTAPEPSPLDRRMFGQKMRHYGDRVAAVVAETEGQAEAALKTIKVEYEVLKPVLSIAEAMAEDAPVVHNGVISYGVGAPDNLEEQNKSSDPRDGRIHFNFPFGGDPKKNIAARGHGEIGDIDKGFAEADVILERSYQSRQAQQLPPEQHLCYTYMEGDRIIVRAATQVPWHVRRKIAIVLGIRQNKVHVIKERLGGGFGSKQDILVEEVCAFATHSTGRPVLFRHTREEEFIATSTRHVAEIDIRMGAKNDGTITAFDVNYRFNTGPYGNHSLTVPCNAPAISLPLYPCPNVRFKVDTYYSNIVPTGAYQGYGGPKGNFAVQMIVAEMADVLGIDHLDMIERNRVHEGQRLDLLGKVGEGKLPSAVPVAHSCALGRILEEGAANFGWHDPKEDSDNLHIKVGRGIATMQQKSGIPDIDQANAWVKLASDGTLIVHSGGADIGTGLDTVVTKLTAEVLCTELSEIHVVSGDTDHCLFDKGAYASSGTCFSGNAAKQAAEDLRCKILDTAAHLLKETVEELTVEYPGLVKGSKGSISFGDIAHYAESGTGCGQLMGQGSFITSEFAFPYGANFAEVAVDTRTGKVSLRKFHALLDCGTPINPELALGQIYGASMRAIGHTLQEAIEYDDEGRVVNANFADYGAPMVGDLPEEFLATLVPSNDPVGPFGAKSVSEISVNAAAPAIASAIHDATGVWIRDWHITPEKMLKALKESVM
ncbi:molybdopterin-dependent oxidoreductase Mo/Fe-S-binding subunit [Endozoicomonas sp. Mp262]|uniref:molybdopterin-dependent oxidoreductase Mo/Fe-S-binding subunit n=1 Tax=Endozoicomonas sp. Mp262 TaxID=2919499 RepID=UPI0021D864D4